MILRNLKNIGYVLAIVLTIFDAKAQDQESEFVGIYGDVSGPNGTSITTELQLNANGTFRLHTVDYVYPQTFKRYTNEGKWEANGKTITLNPHLKRRQPSVSITEKHVGLKDSIAIKINHYVEQYEHQKLIARKMVDFELLTLYFNKKRKYLNVSKRYSQRSCAWAPRIRNQKIIDTTNTIRIAKQAINKMGIYTYGFTKYVEVKLQDQTSDFIEIDIVVPIDKERMPRNKKVIIKGKRAYFYEVEGKVNTFWLRPLRKKTSNTHSHLNPG